MSKTHPKLSVRRQFTLLSLTRSTLYYTPVGETAANLKLMRLIDEQFPKTPWYGSRQMARWLQREGHQGGRHRGPAADAQDAVAPDLPGPAHQ